MTPPTVSEKAEEWELTHCSERDAILDAPPYTAAQINAIHLSRAHAFDAGRADMKREVLTEINGLMGREKARSPDDRIGDGSIDTCKAILGLLETLS